MTVFAPLRRLLIRLLGFIRNWAEQLIKKLDKADRPTKLRPRPAMSSEWLEQAFQRSYPDPPAHWLNDIRERSAPVSEIPAASGHVLGQLRYRQAIPPGIKKADLGKIHPGSIDQSGRSFLKKSTKISRIDTVASRPGSGVSTNLGQHPAPKTIQPLKKRDARVLGRDDRSSHPDRSFTLSTSPVAMPKAGKPAETRVPFEKKRWVDPMHQMEDKKQRQSESFPTRWDESMRDGAELACLSPAHDPWPSLLEPAGDWHLEAGFPEHERDRLKTLDLEQEGRRWNG